MDKKELKKKFDHAVDHAKKEVYEKIWPNTKKELEKVAENTKQLIIKGEEYLKCVSEKGIQNTKKMALSLRKEKVYYNLGKIAANTPKSQWSKNQKITNFLQEVKKIDKEIKSLFVKETVVKRKTSKKGPAKKK